MTANLLCKHFLRNRSIVTGLRYIYNSQYLGIDKYAEAREDQKKKFGDLKDNFMSRMKQQLTGESSMVFTEDLKAVVHVTDDDPEDIDVFTKMLKKFHKQNKELRFGTFVFGPVVMRMLYYLQKQDIALNLLKDEEIQGFFDQLKSYLLVMDMLYKNGRYQEVLDICDMIQQRPILDTKYPKDAITLVAASCYKLNTPESFAYATNLIRNCREAGAVTVQKALQFFVALAINQNQPGIGMELLSSVINNNNIACNNLKLIILARLDRIKEALDMLSRKTERDSPIQSVLRGDICQSTLDEIKLAIERSNDTEHLHLFDQLCDSLKKSNCITEESLDDILCVPIVPRPIDTRNVFDSFPGDAGARRPPRVRYNERRRRDDAFFDRPRNVPPMRHSIDERYEY